MSPFYSRYNPPPQVPFETGGPSMTKMEFAKEVDINNIMARYDLGTMALIGQMKGPPIYGDASQVPDYHAAMNIITYANEKFAQLDSNLRKRFANSPGRLLEFLQDEGNRDEAVKLGLIEPKPPPPPPPAPPEGGAKPKQEGA